jgi:adenylylsulfate kinase-like enzyme
MRETVMNSISDSLKPFKVMSAREDHHWILDMKAGDTVRDKLGNTLTFKSRGRAQKKADALNNEFMKSLESGL